MKNIVFGAGSIGTRHTKNLLALNEEVEIFDSSSDAREKIGRELGVKTFDHIDSALEQLRSGSRAFICTPADSHVQLATDCAKKGADLFVEKPLGVSRDGLRELVSILHENDLISMIGANLRYDAKLSKLKTLLNEGVIGRPILIRCEFGHDLSLWRPHQDYRDHYAGHRDQGGGTVLDCIHELDIITWIAGSFPISWSAQVAKLSDLEINTEDIATVICRFDGPLLAEVHLDYIQKEYTRYCKVIGESGNLIWNLNKDSSTLEISDSNGRRHFDQMVHFDINDMYLNQLKTFLKCTRLRTSPENNIADSVKILRWALEIRDCRE